MVRDFHQQKVGGEDLQGNIIINKRLKEMTHYGILASTKSWRERLTEEYHNQQKVHYGYLMKKHAG